MSIHKEYYVVNDMNKNGEQTLGFLGERRWKRQKLGEYKKRCGKIVNRNHMRFKNFH